MFPDPGLLTKSVWENKVLPNMGYRLGIQTIGYSPMASYDLMEQTLVLETKVYPEHPLVSRNDWNKIMAYYIQHAPDSFQLVKDENAPLKEFDVETKGQMVRVPNVTMLTYDSISKLFHIGLEPGLVYTFDQKWERKDSIDLHSTPIDFVSRNGHDYLLSIGKMYPSEKKLGSLFLVQENLPIKILSDLHRPVSLTLTI
jgi:hypothetical protein